MKQHVAVAVLSIISGLAMAEEMKFGYSLGGNQNICFLQNIAENIQGKTIHTVSNLIAALTEVSLSESQTNLNL